MNLAVYIPALLLGLAGSLHCVGMCGPIMMSVPVQHLPEKKRFWGILLYQAGRLTTYALLGIVAGWLGWRMEAAGWQQTFSIILGSLILLFLLAKIFSKQFRFNPFRKQLMQLMAWAMRLKNMAAMPILGAANGLLPCGMVYIALTGAAATGGFWNAILFMLFFGIGTLPLLLALAYWGIHLGFRTRQKLQQLVPYMIALTAILLIIRGMNLNIPWLSPMLTSRSGNTVPCH